jgi:hypothetical protein
MRVLSVHARKGKLDESQTREECERCLLWLKSSKETKSGLWTELTFVVFLMRQLENKLFERYPNSPLRIGTLNIPGFFERSLQQDLPSALQQAVGKTVGAGWLLPCVCLWHHALILSPWLMTVCRLRPASSTRT